VKNVRANGARHKRLPHLAGDGFGLPLTAAIQSEQYVLGVLRDTADRIEGRLAFQEKRKPRFKGM